MSLFNNSHAGEQRAFNMTTRSSSQQSSPRSAKRGKSGAGTYGGVTNDSRRIHAPALRSITSTQAVHQPDLWEIVNSVVGPQNAKKRDGEKRKPREKVRWEGLQMFGWVDGAWKPAAYHIAFREKMILRDAQQPGAPVWRRGDSIDYTSYSPLTPGWTQDPHSIKDRQGREVLMIPRPSKYGSSNSKPEPLMYEGLVIIDINNEPMKDFPGAPLALKSNENAWFLEGLRRCFGMTVWDLRCRMIPVRNTPNGRMPLQGYTDLTNRLRFWRKGHNKDNPGHKISSWHPRGGKRTVDHDEDAESSQQAEEDEGQEEELVPPTPSRAFYEVASDPISDPVPSSSTVHMPTMPEQTSWEGNRVYIPTFPGTNTPAQMTNTVPSDSTYTATCPPTFAPANIYSSAGNPCDSAPANIYPSPYDPNLRTSLPAQTTVTVPSDSVYTATCPPNFVSPSIYSSAGYPYNFTPAGQYPALDISDPGTHPRAQKTNTVGSDSIHFAGYAPALASPNVYTSPAYPFHLSHTDGYSSPYAYNNPATTAPGPSYMPSFTNSTPMTPWNSWMQPEQNVDQAWQGDFGLQPEFQAHPEPHPPVSGSSSAQPTTAATSPPVLPEQNTPTMFSSSETDPFMGADWSSDTAEEWL